MLHRYLSAVLVIVAIAVEAMLLLQLVSGTFAWLVPSLWFVIHVLVSIGLAVSLYALPASYLAGRSVTFASLVLAVGLFVPLLGAVGVLAALLHGFRQSGNRHYEEPYWQFTDNAELPFVAPVGRNEYRHDGRGFVEQVQYTQDNEALYRKVLASRHIRNSLSVSGLKSAIAHQDEKIRLTAYQILDRKVTRLNREIQRLEDSVDMLDTEEKSNTWLQIASNYWELLTLEQDEPVARQQLLEKAAAAAAKAIRILPSNRNAHFTSGRILLLQGKERLARIEFERAMALGMPAEKVLPYLAEAAFVARDFKSVGALLGKLDKAFSQYPPLSHVAGYWT